MLEHNITILEPTKLRRACVPPKFLPLLPGTHPTESKAHAPDTGKEGGMESLIRLLAESERLVRARDSESSCEISQSCRQTLNNSNSPLAFTSSNSTKITGFDYEWMTDRSHSTQTAPRVHRALIMQHSRVPSESTKVGDSQLNIYPLYTIPNTLSLFFISVYHPSSRYGKVWVFGWVCILYGQLYAERIDNQD